LLVSVAREEVLRELVRDARVVPAFPLDVMRDARLARTIAASAEFARLSRYYRILDPAEETEARLLAALSRGTGVLGVLRAIDQRPRALEPVVRPVARADLYAPLHLRSRVEGGLGIEPAWRLSGSLGEAVQIADAEWAWLPEHEDLPLPPRSRDDWADYPEVALADHGTATLGVLVARHENGWALGIVPGAQPIRAPLANGTTVDRAGGLWSAVARLFPGDVLLIEDHVEGPDDGTNQGTGKHLIPDEWYPAIGSIVRCAIDAGLVVVAAAGNGGRDLDSPLYDTGLPGFPAEWHNPFRREHSTGALLVGAGEPGLGGSTAGLAIGASNYGACVDVQAWGACVVTCGPIGMGPVDRQNTATLYTNVYGGTSSASAIIAGIVALVQSARKRAERAPLGCAEFKEGFDATGWVPEPVEPHKAIGPVPDAEALMAWALARP
jgi:hypothetical protein